MEHADSATVEWNSAKKRWEVHVLAGQDVIKRPIGKRLADASEAVLKELACATARDEGYEVGPDSVAVQGHGSSICRSRRYCVHSTPSTATSARPRSSNNVMRT